MDGRPTLIWLLIFSLHTSGWVSGTFHGIYSCRRELTATKGFISIDCGIAPDSHYIDDGLQILYISDEDFIDTGINYNVSMEYIDNNASKQYMNVRSFPEGNKNCYNPTTRRRQRKEIMNVPTTDDLYVYLVNIGSGTPFISTLELRPLNNSIYDKSEPGSLLLFNRWDFGKEEDDYLISDVDDVLDRVRETFMESQWATVKAPY
ncbi:putative leucine-rich repeat receptor-like serine/threonine-protein kinase [Vitis vinifera]|uniref:Putative leucine-rich repeat receptor-like serine/threonine-protein kinase n=1 Tax=Vitis vinifera TaxID=29760 RepID=A0A438EW75_VITVI|nr:putative leucine-rich repeat receptor-like serine/threonine-protein kinase [Vitis vinifera]